MRPAARAERSPTLLEQVRGLVERTYDHSTGLGPLAEFLVGDEGFRRLVAREAPAHRVGNATEATAGPGAQVLLRSGRGGELLASLYFPARLIRTLEQHPPGHAVHDENVDAFAGFIEEIDHLLLLAARARGGPSLTLLELELHANVTKELVVRHFLERKGAVGALPPDAVDWVRYHLFRKPRFSDPDSSVRDRYRDAARYAVRYLERLDRLPRRRRVRDLRRFSRMSHQQKLRLIERAA